MCAYTENIGTLTLEAAANSLMRDLTATNVVLRGKLQTPTQSCGELDGQVDLIMLSLQGDGDICIFTRIIADRLSRRLRTTVYVDNKPGAGGAVGALEVTRAAPDGATIAFSRSARFLRLRRFGSCLALPGSRKVIRRSRRAY